MFFWICSIFLIHLLYILNKSTCSRVIDAVSQKSVYVAEYCPKMPYCKEGTHVMCMFYDKDKELGPHCLNSPNITITPGLASKLLEISNAIRSKLALGKEKGKGGAPLPRAYGMLRLQWDEELATFAQVLANQCVLRHDICRATKTFPDPGQTAGLVRYTYPDWNSISKTLPKDENNIPGLVEEKLIYAIKQSTRSWYIQKASVSPEMITNYPDWQQYPLKHAGRLYLEMITGHATHMGCGMSAYTEYAYNNAYAAMNYNSIQIICNFSARPSPGTSVYNTEPPSNPLPGTQCGCPTGYDEDEDCLCNENPHYKPIPKPKHRSCTGKNCVPPVVLLPIIAMEDAPPHKLKRYENETQDQLDLDIMSHDDPDNIIGIKEAFPRNDFEKTLREARNNLQQARLLANAKHLRKVQNRHFGENPLTPENRRQTQSIHEGLDHVRPSAKQNPKTSLFLKVNKFKLPPKIPIKKDVLPRKDFTKVQNLANSYLNKKRNFNDEQTNNDLNVKNRIIQPIHLHDVTTKVYVVGYNDGIVNNISNTNLQTKSTNEDTDKKVMHLLDNLEQEVKHVNLDDSEKEILDDKLRKIYIRISNEPKDLIYPNDSPYKNKIKEREKEEFLKYENRVNEHLLNEQRRDAQNYFRERSNTQPINDDETSNIQNQLIAKERDYNENLGTLKTRLEKPINENEYSVNSNLKFNNRLNTRNMNALIEYDHNKFRDLTNDGNLDKDLRHNFRKIELPDDRSASKNYDDARPKNYYLVNHFDNEGQINFKRRKFYQNKIDYLERKLEKVRTHRRPNQPNEERPMRHFEPDRNEMQIRPSQPKTRKNAFYMPDRARSVHGF